MPHFINVLILYINLLNLSGIKATVFEEYGAFKVSKYLTYITFVNFILQRLCSVFLQDQYKTPLFIENAD